MNIGIDARSLFLERTVARKCLIDLIMQLQNFDHENNFFLFSSNDFDFSINNRLWQKIICKSRIWKNERLWLYPGLPQLKKKYGIVLFWGEEQFPALGRSLLNLFGAEAPESYSRYYEDFQKALNKVSKSFCLAKWLQTTLHLHNGFTHSCHHPVPHKIPLAEVKKNPCALHNTSFKKNQRKLMLDGNRPPECNYCWQIEDSSNKHFSDRVLKSADSWAWPFRQRVMNHDWNYDINPTYLEVSFGNECNLKCAYCSPDKSSALWCEYQKFGTYPTSVPLNDLGWLEQTGRKPYGPNEKNPYVKAFWKWFPKIADGLRVFRITGGEPLLNSNTFKVLDYMKHHPLPGCELGINSNGFVPNRLYETFLEKSKELIATKKISDLYFFASIDTHGEQAEYIRYGLGYKKFLDNIYRYLDTTGCKLTFMVTFSLLSIPGFNRFLEDVLILNRRFNSDRNSLLTYGPRILLDVSCLHHPPYLSAMIINDQLLDKLRGIHSFMIRNSKEAVGLHGFADYEINKIQRIISMVESGNRDNQEITRLRRDFFLFINEFDRRKGLSFLKTFPLMDDFYKECGSSH